MPILPVTRSSPPSSGFFLNRNQRARRRLPVLLGVPTGIAVLACGTLACMTLMRPWTPPPTVTPPPTATPLPTSRATPAPAASPTPSVRLATYVHPSGAFSVALPLGWSVNESHSNADALRPGGAVFINTEFTHVGRTLDAAALAKYIDAVEHNWFGSFGEYEQIENMLQAGGSIEVVKTVRLSSGTPQTVFSYYWHEGTVVFALDFWVASDQVEAYAELRADVLQSVQRDAQAGAQLPLYAVTYTFAGPKDYFHFEVPYGWTHDSGQEGDLSMDTFSAPDQAAAVESLVYEAGSTLAGEALLKQVFELLSTAHGVSEEDLRGAAPQDDGSVRVDWSRSDGLNGSTFYAARGDDVLVLTWLSDVEGGLRYLPVWEMLLESYRGDE